MSNSNQQTREETTDRVLKDIGSIIGTSLITIGSGLPIARYVALKIQFKTGIPLKADDMEFLKAYEELLALKPRAGEKPQDFLKRKQAFFQERYQFFLEYKSFAKKVNISLCDYVLMNVDATLNRRKWVQSAKKLNKELGGQLSDDVIERMSKQILSYSPRVGKKVTANYTTEELLHTFVRQANTPPNGKYFACMLEDFATKKVGSVSTFVPDNGWLKANIAEGVCAHPLIDVRGLSHNFIQIANNNMEQLQGTVMHEFYHAINSADVFKIRMRGDTSLSLFFDEALSKSVNWLMDDWDNSVRTDIRLYYEAEAKKLYPDDVKKQVRHAYKRARGQYIKIMLAGDADNIKRAISDFYSTTGAVRTATDIDVQNVVSNVKEWYKYYQDSYGYRTPKKGASTIEKINAYLSKHFGPDVRMSENLLYELNLRNRIEIFRSLRKCSDGTYKIEVETVERAKGVLSDLKRQGIKGTIKKIEDGVEIIIPARYKKEVLRLQALNYIILNENRNFCFERKKVNGSTVYELPEGLTDHPPRLEKIKDYWAKQGVEIVLDPATNRYQIKSQCVAKYEEAVLKVCADLRLNQIKIAQDGSCYIDIPEMSNKEMTELFEKYDKMGFDVVSSRDGKKIYFEDSDTVDKIHKLFGDEIYTRCPNLKPQGIDVPPSNVQTPENPTQTTSAVEDKTLHATQSAKGEIGKTSKTIKSFGEKAMKGLKIAGVAADVGGAAIDPEGTAEFHDDLLHARFKKIAGELEEGIDTVSSQPISETASQISDAVGGAVSEYYAGAETTEDYAKRTGQAAVSGVENVALVAGAAVGSTGDALYSLANLGLEQIGVDTRFVSNPVSLQELKDDPIAYLGARLIPETQSTKTGIRSDDTYFTIIDRNDLRAMQNYINHHKGQWIGQKSRINLENHFKTVDENGHPTEATRIEKTVQTPVVYAAFEGKRDMVSLLITDPRMYGYVYEPDQHSGQTALMRLMDRMPNHYFSKERQQQKQLIKDILSHADTTPENINKVDKWGNSAFLYAAKVGDTEVLVALSKRKANPLQTNNNGENALHLYQGDDPTMISAFINAGVDKNQKDSNGRTPLERQIYDCVANPSQSAYLRVALFLEFATKEELEALCANPDMAKRLKQIVDSNPKVAIELQKAHPEFYASSYGRPSQSSAIRTLNDNGESAKPEPTINTGEQSQTRPTNNKNEGKE